MVKTFLLKQTKGRLGTTHVGTPVEIGVIMDYTICFSYWKKIFLFLTNTFNLHLQYVKFNAI